jgi:hypothetical protein
MQWPGSQIVIFSMMVDYAGKMVPGIRVRPPGGAQQGLPQASPAPQPAPQVGWSQGGTGPGPGAPKNVNPFVQEGNPPAGSDFPGDQPSRALPDDEIPFK